VNCQYNSPCSILINCRGKKKRGEEKTTSWPRLPSLSLPALNLNFCSPLEKKKKKGKLAAADRLKVAGLPEPTTKKKKRKE